MTISRITTGAVALAATFAAGGCASAPNVFDRHEAAVAERAVAEANADRRTCPVIVSNSTDRHLEVEYRAGGVKSELGLLPAGQRVVVDVFCDTGSVEAFGVASMGEIFGEGIRYRTTARIDRSRAAVLMFTEMQAVR